MRILPLIACPFLFTFSLNAQSFEWARSFGNANYDDDGRAVVSDENGNVYTTGRYGGVVDFDPGPGTSYLSSAGESDIYVQKLDSSGNLIWARSFGGINYDWGFSIDLDQSGNVYTAGFFQLTADFDPGTGVSNETSNGDLGLFIQKMDANGDFLWSKALPASQLNTRCSIDADQFGNVYTTSSFEGTVDLDPGTGVSGHVSAGGNDIYIQKLDASGNFVWGKTFGGAGNDFGSGISLDASGNIYTTGVFDFTVDFDPGIGTENIISNGGYDVYIQKIDTSGNFLWAKSFGGPTEDFAMSVCADLSGNVYTTGYFQLTVDFDPGPGEASFAPIGDIDAFVQKMDPSGNYLWARTFGGLHDDYAESVDVDDMGNVYTTGSFEFIMNVGAEELLSAGNYDIFVSKMDNSGNFIWAASYGDIDYDRGRCIHVSPSADIYLTGEFRKTVDFEPGEGVTNLVSTDQDDFSPVYADVFIQKMSPCSSNTIVESAFASPASDNCDGTLSLSISGNPDFELIVDGNTPVTSSGYTLFSDLCPGIHDLQIINSCGISTMTQFVIPVDSNYIFNNPFVDSLAQDSLGITLEDCDIYYAGIDTAYIDSIWADGNTVNVIWNIVDSDGSNFDTTSYEFNSEDGVYWLQLSVFCPTKSTEDYFAVGQAVYFQNGNVFTVGIDDPDRFGALIYPNPTNDEVTISFSAVEADLTIFNAQGKLIGHNRVHSGEKVSLHGADPGVYFFELSTESGRTVKRVVKQ